jgi:serine protease Do
MPFRAVLRGTNQRQRCIMRTLLAGVAALCLLGLMAGAAAADGYIGVQVKKAAAEDGGVIVVETQPDSPAMKAGLKADDLIVKVDGKEFKGLQDFIAVIRARKPGEVITLTLFRDGKEMDLKVTVGERP